MRRAGRGGAVAVVALVAGFGLTGCEAVEVEGALAERATLRGYDYRWPDGCADGVYQVIFGDADDWGGIEMTHWNAVYCVHTSASTSPPVGPGAFDLTTTEGVVQGTIAGTARPRSDGQNGYQHDLVWTVTGGTGRYAGATGTLTMDAQGAFAGQSVTGTITGTINLP
jgi:hypothetical protein